MSEMDMEEPEFKAKQLRFEYSTADLIAELEKRRPCERCGRNASYCSSCKWLLPKSDNFKEEK